MSVSTRKYAININIKNNFSKLKISSGKLQNLKLIITYIQKTRHSDCNHIMECWVITSIPLPDIDNINNNFLKRPQQPINLLLNTCFPFMIIEIFLFEIAWPYMQLKEIDIYFLIAWIFLIISEVFLCRFKKLSTFFSNSIHPHMMTYFSSIYNVN